MVVMVTETCPSCEVNKHVECCLYSDVQYAC